MAEPIDLPLEYKLNFSLKDFIKDFPLALTNYPIWNIEK